MIHIFNRIISIPFARFALVLYSAILIALCLSNANQVNVMNIMTIDKVLHAIAFFIFGSIGFFASRSQQQFFIVLAAGFFLGLGIEWAQSWLTDSRQADVYDQVANTGGLIIAFIMSKAYKFIKPIEPQASQI